jgi:hypothetical protein
MTKNSKIKWLPEPQEKDYPAAESYLNLLRDEVKSRKLVKKLKKVEVVKFKSKDIFRASGLSLLGISNSHVGKDRKRILEGKPLSPILLVRDVRHGKLVIADGYHRLCAVYSFNEDERIPCKIV